MNTTDPRAAAAAAWRAAMEETTMDKGTSAAVVVAAGVVTVGHVVFLLRMRHTPALAPFTWNLVLGAAAGMLWLWGMVWDARVSTTPPASPDDLPTPTQCVGYGLWATWVLGEGVAVAAFLYRVATACAMARAHAYGTTLDPAENDTAGLISADTDVAVPTAATVPRVDAAAPPTCCGCVRPARHGHAPCCHVAAAMALTCFATDAYTCQMPRALLSAVVPLVVVTATAAVITFSLPRDEAFVPDLASGCALADTARTAFSAALAAQALYIFAVLATHNTMIHAHELRYPAWFFAILVAAVALDIGFNAAAWSTDARDAPPFRAIRVVVVAVLLSAFTGAQVVVQLRTERAASSARQRRMPAARQPQRTLEMVDVTLTDTDDTLGQPVPGPRVPRQQPVGGDTVVADAAQRDRLVAAVRAL